MSFVEGNSHRDVALFYAWWNQFDSEERCRGDGVGFRRLETRGQLVRGGGFIIIYILQNIFKNQGDEPDSLFWWTTSVQTDEGLFNPLKDLNICHMTDDSNFSKFNHEKYREKDLLVQNLNLIHPLIVLKESLNSCIDLTELNSR